LGVGLTRQPPPVRRSLPRAVPHPHKAMLKNGKLIELFAAVVQQPLDQLRFDASTRLLERAADGLLELQARQSGDEILACAHRFRQACEERTVSDEVRAHGDEDVNVRHAAGVEQNLDEQRRFVAGLGLGDARPR
jgi:hypothetical protein